MRSEQLDLLIVGAGPAGLLASIIASSLGLAHRVVERRVGLHTEPSAHVVKTHSMEVYRRIGITAAINAVATPAALQQCVTWCESVEGMVFGRLDLRGKKGPVQRFFDVSPAHSANLPQSVLEPILYERATAAGGADVVRFGAAFAGLDQDADGVTATIATDGGEERVRCRYLIGADGASSRVRRAVGIAFDGPPVLAHMLAIHITSDVRPLLERNPGVLFRVRSPRIDGNFIMHQPVGSQVFMMRFDPEETPFERFDKATARAIVAEAFGGDHRFEISSIGRWAMSAQVATHYRQERVLLVGDAAHRFPPTGGLGLNTGVEDVENIMWKLGAVLRGEAGTPLLDSYQAECRPVAQRNTAQSVTNHRRAAEVDAAIGSAEGSAAFAATIAALRTGTAGSRPAAIQAAIDAQLIHYAHLEFEMAASFAQGAFVASDRAIAKPVAVCEGFQPSFTPGTCMPHLWIAPGVSTIDRLRFDSLTLFAPADEAGKWAEAVAALPPGRIAIEVVALTGAMRSDRATAADFWGGQPYAILVRPDSRIAWIEPAAVRDRTAALHDATDALMTWQPMLDRAEDPRAQDLR